MGKAPARGWGSSAPEGGDGSHPSSAAAAGADGVDASLDSLDAIPAAANGAYTPRAVAAIADAVRASPTIVSLSILANSLEDDEVSMLLKLKEDKRSLQTLCGLAPTATSADYAALGLTDSDSRLLAPELQTAPSLARLDVRWNELGASGELRLRTALKKSASASASFVEELAS